SGRQMARALPWEHAPGKSISGSPLIPPLRPCRRRRHPSAWTLIGWADNTHLVVQEVSLDGANLRLLTLDIKSGTLRLLSSFPLAQIGSPRFSMTPDGKHVLVSSCSFRDEPFIHRLALIVTVSGVYHTLNNTRAKTSSCLDFMAFQQDSGR